MAIQRIQDTDPQLVSTLRIEHFETVFLAEGLRGQFALDSVAAYGIAEHAGGSPLLAIHLAETLVEQTEYQARSSESTSLSGSWDNALNDGRLTLTPALSAILTRKIDAKLRNRDSRVSLRRPSSHGDRLRRIHIALGSGRTRRPTRPV